MMSFNTLLQLNIKRAFKALPQLIFGATALIFLVSAVAFCGNKYLYGAISEVASSEKYPVAIIMEDDSLIATKVTDTLLEMKEVSEYLDIHFTTKEDAISMLENGQILAAVHIPKDTANNIINGTNTPMTIIFPEDSGYEAVLIKELSQCVTSMLSSAQAGIYSIYDFYGDMDADDEIDGALLRMNLKYIKIAAAGNKMFEKSVVTATGSVPIITYYICGALVLFSLLLGINCYNCILKLSSYNSKRLSLNSIPLIYQGLSAYIAIAISQLTTIAIVSIPAIFVLKMFDLSLNRIAILGLIATVPLFILISSAFCYLISALTEHVIGRVMITFFITIIMCFISGCFIPTIMLPDIIQTISKLLPTHYMISFSSSFLSGSFNLPSLIICICYGILIFAAGLLATFINRRKELC